MPILTANDHDELTVSTTPVVSKTLHLGYALRWHLLVTNATGGNSVTAVRIRRYLKTGGTPTEWESITAGLPLAMGASLSVRETDGCESDIEVEVTADDPNTGVQLALVGV